MDIATQEGNMTGIAYYTLQADGFGGCGHRHTTIRAAESCLEANRRKYRSLPGGNCFCPWRIDACDDKGHSVFTDDDEH